MRDLITRLSGFKRCVCFVALRRYPPFLRELMQALIDTGRPELASELVDPSLGTVYALGIDTQGRSVLYVLDGQSLALLRSATFDSAYQPQGLMARWGTNGLVLSDANRVYLLSGMLVGP